MTQDKLAEAASVSKSFLSELENDKANASSQILLQIANALGASVDYLLQGAVSAFSDNMPVVIPPNLSKAAEELGISYSETRELLDAHNSVVARRSSRLNKGLSVDEWKRFHKAIKTVFG
jgi:transcriptional regulator with XRE-family HTH domain